MFVVLGIILFRDPHGFPDWFFGDGDCCGIDLNRCWHSHVDLKNNYPEEKHNIMAFFFVTTLIESAIDRVSFLMAINLQSSDNRHTLV